MKNLNLPNPHLLILAGIPGSGKTFFAKHFAKTYNLPIISCSVTTEILFEQPDHSNEERAIVQRLNLNELEQMLKTKSTVIYDGNTDSRASRQEAARLARASGYTPIVVWIQTDTPTALQRATSRVVNSSPVSHEVFNKMLTKFTSPNHAEKHIVISGKHTPASQVRNIVAKLKPNSPKV